MRFKINDLPRQPEARLEILPDDAPRDCACRTAATLTQESGKEQKQLFRHKAQARKVKCEVVYRNDPERPLTDPVPELGGRRLIVRLYRGDYCDPMFDPDGWFEPRAPFITLRRDVKKWILPFVAWRWPFMAKGFYLGFKLYGVDSEHYLHWLPASEVFVGSQAVHFSFRPFSTIKEDI